MYGTSEVMSGWGCWGETGDGSLEGERHLGHEEVDDVQVEGDGGDHILVVGVALEQHVGVEDDEAREHQGGQEPVDGDADPSHREEDLRGPVDYNITL